MADFCKRVRCANFLWLFLILSIYLVAQNLPIWRGLSWIKRLPPGAKEDELDPLPWLNVSALFSVTAVLCSLIIYKIIKRRSDVVLCNTKWYLHISYYQRLVVRGVKILFSKIFARIISRTSKHGILAGNHSSRVESSANGKFHNHHHGVKSSFRSWWFINSGISNFATAIFLIIFTFGVSTIVATRMVRTFYITIIFVVTSFLCS